MRVSFGFVAIFITSALAADLPCDVDAENCRAVMDATACFNEYMSGGNKNTIMNCLVGTDGAGTPKEKVSNIFVTPPSQKAY